ncbi:hypothetical protein QBC40DRAFT_192499 [Triangularia verruculosa]|uniref:Nuclear rim protein 1 n=1 Tax=Triangularia verruculosa TaxID=2587418 RepID=A0AAN7B0M3_9PEZI|nr:hypothetical protein QBC40DRAFT_192499 [Triangularia verruculosa]
MPPARRPVRRQPLSERIKARLNPGDFYLWLSEEIQTFDWDSTAFGTRFGLAANFLFLIARANIASRSDVDDVFGDAPASGPLTFLIHSSVWALTAISCLNAFYTLTRSRTYRLFEANVESNIPHTPSAHRVRVDSSPASSSPLGVIQNLLSSETAEQRAHPDKTRDVWEMKVWDPYPATLRLFCLFSPGHVLIHWLFLPLVAMDPRPSVTVFKCFALQVILSAQLWLMHSKFTRQARDNAIIQKEVMHEYDVKFVHPRLRPVYREVGTQVSINEDKIEQEYVAVGTPSSVIRRNFETHPNPNYAKIIDPDGFQSIKPRPTFAGTPRGRVSTNPFTPLANTAARPSTPGTISTPSAQLLGYADRESHNLPASVTVNRRSMPAPAVSSTGSFTKSFNSSFENDAPTPVPKPPSMNRAVSPFKSGTPMRSTSSSNPLGVPPSYGGSMGLYQHKDSPLKKTMSMEGIPRSPRNNREMAALEQRQLSDRFRDRSPIKSRLQDSRSTGTEAVGRIEGGDNNASAASSSVAHSPEKLANLRANRWTQERFPTRRL